MSAIQAGSSLGIALGICSLILAGCHREPTIVIHFEPNDLAASQAKPALVVENHPKPPPAAVAQAADGQVCAVDADCVLEPVDCCDCTKGGAVRAVSRAAAAAHKQKEQERCREMMCAQVMSNDVSCQKRAACYKGGCTLVPKE